MTDLASGTRSSDEPDLPRLPGPWGLMWRKFKRHKLAVFSLAVLILIYLVALFAEFFAPAAPDRTSVGHTFAPPQSIRFFVPDGEGGSRFLLHVNDYRMEIDQVALRRNFVLDEETVIPVGFFVESEPYELLGLFTLETKFFGTVDPNDRMYLLGADRLGRDLLSRIVIGTRISMSIGLVGVVVSLVLGVFFGGVSGYFGGWIDTVIQRVIEFLRSIPTIPLWMGLAAAIPLGWPPLRTYFVVTIIVSMVGWTTLAREVRGKFLSLRHEDFVTAARLDGLTEFEVIRKHMVPSFISHIIASLTLAVPVMILAETSLSFLGIGLQSPIISWGVLLQEAQNIRTIAQAPWLLIWPSMAIVVAVLTLNFLGDGLRDAADPYSR